MINNTRWKMISSEPSNETASGISYKFECPFCGEVIVTGTMNGKFLPETCPSCRSDMRYKRKKSENPVTLRKFLSIIGKSLILTPYDCYVYIVEDDPFFEETDRLVMFGKRDTLPSLECLEPYMDYEVVKFNENRDYDEIIDQGLWLREIRFETASSFYSEPSVGTRRLTLFLIHSFLFF